MEKGSQGWRCCAGEADGEQLELGTHIWRNRARGKVAALVTAVPLATTLGLQGTPRSVPGEGLMLLFQVDSGEGVAVPWPRPSEGIYLLGFVLHHAEGSPGGGAAASSSICIHVNQQST